MDEVKNLEIISLADIYKARENTPKQILNTPLIKLHLDIPDKEIYLKLENVQPMGSFKVRGAYNAIQNSDKEQLKTNGVYTSSAGNFAQGLVWSANQFGVKCTTVIPNTAPKVKVDAIKSLGAHVIPVSFSDWWKVMTTEYFEGQLGSYIHPSCNRHVMAGNGVIGLEIIEQLPDVSSIIVPYGGGGNCVGIASAVKQFKPNVTVYACEVETSTPFKTSLLAGKPVSVENYKKSFVDGMGGKSMFPCMWDITTKTLTGSIVTSLQEICDAINILVKNNHIVSEGAGSATVAAALKDKNLNDKIVCVITGGNIDQEKLITILKGGIPEA